MKHFTIHTLCGLLLFCLMIEAASASQNFTLTGNVLGPSCSVSADSQYDFGVLSATDVHGESGTSKMMGAPLHLALKCTGSRGGMDQKSTLMITGKQFSTDAWPEEAKNSCFLDSSSSVKNSCIFLSKTVSTEDILTVDKKGNDVIAELPVDNIQTDGSPTFINLTPGVMGWSDNNAQSGVLRAVISVSLVWK